MVNYRRWRFTTRNFDEILHLACPAKVNLSLEVVGRRPDGYHELRSVMVPISLADDLYLRLVREPGIQVTVEGAELPTGSDNLVHRAADLLLETTASTAPGTGADPGRPNGTSRPASTLPGVEIRLVKRIPISAGLGGGSSDAASTLVGLNRLAGARLGDATLAELGLHLGADVPFFLSGRPALATGVGEHLLPLPPFPPLWMVLLDPGFAVSTAWVYRELDAMSGQDVRLTPLGDQVTIDRFLEGPASAGRALRNDLERVTLRAFPSLRGLMAELSACGAVGTLMSGSGPTIFGIFLDEHAARRGYERLRERDDRTVYLVRSI